MNNLSLKLVNAGSFNPTILIDGKTVKQKKNKYGSYEINYSTANSKAEIRVYRYLELGGKLWPLMSLLFFVISVFGIFDIPYSKKSVVLDCCFNVDLSENTKVKFTFNDPAKTEKAITIESESNVQEIKNIFYVDKKVDLRRKILMIVKTVVWIGLALLVGILVIKKIGV